MLRDKLGLTGSKEGCGSGDCGACSVTINGRLVCSCLVLAPEAEGVKIETIEGMADGDKLHPLQKKFVEMAALQCGICTPGFLVASQGAARENPNPTETEVRYWLAGNLCRCTGYDKIITAVLDVAAEMREPPNEPIATSSPKRAKYKWIGTRPDRPDGADKVTGRARFGADFNLPGQLIGKVLRSPHAARDHQVDRHLQGRGAAPA